MFSMESQFSDGSHKSEVAELQQTSTEEPDGTCIPNPDAWMDFTGSSLLNTRRPRIFVPHADLEQGWDDWKGLEKS